MKITRRELLNIQGRKEYDYHMDQEIFRDDPFLRMLENVDARIVLYYDALDELHASVDISGNMVCPCAITLEDVRVPFEISDDTRLSFIDEEDSYFIEKELDVWELCLSFILPEVPIKVVKSDEIEYPRGDGWRVMTEEAYEESKKQEIDPRWAKLKEYKFDEED